MVSRERELIAAQHDATFIPADQQGPAHPDSRAPSKPASLLSVDSGLAAGKMSSFSSHNKVQSMQALASIGQGQQLGEAEGGGLGWGQQNVSRIAGLQNLADAQSSSGRHTHQE